MQVGSHLVTRLKEFTGYLPNSAVISAQSKATGFESYTPAPAPPGPDAFSNRLNTEATVALQEIRPRLIC